MTNLSGHSLSIVRGDRRLFRNRGFSLEGGELLVIEGPNGSGKTSLLRGIAGMLEFDDGEISWDGALTKDIWQNFRAELVWLSHRVGFKKDLNVTENLTFETRLRSGSLEELDNILFRLGLENIATLPLGLLSAGQKRRAGLARLLVANGRLWLLDEPLTNLDKSGQALVLDLIGEHLESGGLCVAASHNVLEIEAKTHRLVLK